MKRNYFYISHTKKEINRVFYLQASVSNSKKNKDTEDIMNFPLIYGHLFSNKKKINTILAISSSCYFTRWKERSQDEISFSIFSEMTLFEKKGSESIKIQFHVAFMTKNIERTVINVCFKMNLYFTNWQFYATLWSPKVNQDHCMCIVYVMFKMLENKLFVENFYLLKIIIKKKTLNEAMQV